MTALMLNLRTTRELLDWRVLGAYPAILAASLPVWPFGWHLALHVLGASLLIGNALVMAVWLTAVGFSRTDAPKRRAARVVNTADVWFTVPGVILILLNGLAMVGARYGGAAAFSTTGWIAGGLLLLTLTALVWALRLVPAQLTLYRLAQRDGPLDEPAFHRALKQWYAWGVVATVLPLLAVVLMTTKPSL